ncbi:ER membrane protein complex subunit 8/9 homolog [Orussus abietinus]|uniref:ER membrane protein complex subunit 8/9 homolog n=1 Tax=Orussus abietinus TaxID=222816 RepID=UPI000C715D50|nr:ER membrane protein complex subunit 8/9 homolog [Orussus abietinus]
MKNILQIDQLASRKGLVIAGYYFANENINDTSIDKPAHRIADKIAENFSGALLVALDNKELSYSMKSNPLRVSQHVDGKWEVKDKSNLSYEGGTYVLDLACWLLKSEKQRSLIDFDNHLDNVALDFQNQKLNEIIESTKES